MRRDLKFGFFARRSVFLYIRDQSFDVCFQVEIVYIQQGFAVGSLLEEFPGFVRSWFAGKCFSWFQNDLLRRSLWQGLPRVFDILVLFGIKVVNFLCSGREGFQLYTRVCLASSSGLWLFRGMTSKCQVWRLLHMEQGVVRGE